MTAHKSLAALLTLMALSTLFLLPTTTQAQVSQWEFFEPRPRDFSRLRKVADTTAIEFGGQRIDVSATWTQLSDAERAAVRQAQVPPVPEADEPPYPTRGLKPLIERFHRVRGPANTPLRLHLDIDTLGQVQALATDVQLPGQFMNDLLYLFVNSGFKPGQCGGQACNKRLTLDVVHVGP